MVSEHTRTSGRLHRGGSVGLAGGGPALVLSGADSWESITALGDVNGDGYGDIAVGMPGWGGGRRGAVAVVCGYAGDDRDSDGYGAEPYWRDCDEPAPPQGDCDDGDGGVSPVAADPPGDCVDQDCDGEGGPDSDEDEDEVDCVDELAMGTDPLDPDTDGEGIGDADDLEPLVPDRRCGCGTAPVLGPCGALLALLALSRCRR
ncbi:MAG: hypothetical protein GY913_10400 [Proteobacteria bacterium]|nr:hypothetical protein [Pseudomonadota bacterium]